MKPEEKIKELEHSIEFWKEKQKVTNNEVEKSIYRDKIRKAENEIKSLETEKKEPKITHIVDAPPLADKESSISTKLLERGQVIDTSNDSTVIL